MVELFAGHRVEQETRTRSSGNAAYSDRRRGAREVFATFTNWAEEGDDAKIAPVLDKFATY